MSPPSKHYPGVTVTVALSSARNIVITHLRETTRRVPRHSDAPFYDGHRRRIPSGLKATSTVMSPMTKYGLTSRDSTGDTASSHRCQHRLSKMLESSRNNISRTHATSRVRTNASKIPNIHKRYHTFQNVDFFVANNTFNS